MTIQRLESGIRKEQIKKAVLNIISTKGLASLTTRNLAAEVGFSEGAIFRHFKNKKDIISSIIKDVDNHLVKIQKAIAYSNRPPEKRLKEFFCKHVHYLIENKGITILLFSEVAHMNEPRLKHKLSNILKEQKKCACKILIDGMKSKKWDPSLNADNVAMLYMGVPISLNIELVLNKNNFREEHYCKSMINLISRVLVNNNIKSN